MSVIRSTIRHRRLIALAVAAGATVAAVPTAGAHSGIVAQSPKAGSVVKAPKAAVAIFSGPIIRGNIRVTGPRGVVASRGTGTRDPRNVRRVSVPLKPKLARGTYRVVWNVTSSDGHRQRGSWTFRVRR